MNTVLIELDKFEDDLLNREYIKDKSGESYFNIYETMEEMGDLYFHINKEKYLILIDLSTNELLKVLKENFPEEISNPHIIGPLILFSKNRNKPLSEISYFMKEGWGTDLLEKSIPKYFTLHLVYKLCLQEKK